MRAVHLVGHGGVENLVLSSDVPRPTPRPGEVLVAVRAAAVNNTDVASRTNWYATPGGGTRSGTPEGLALPRVQGAGASGRIVEVGAGVDGRRIGEVVVVDPFIRDLSRPPLRQLVALLGTGRDGAFADHVAVPTENAVPAAGSGLSFAQLACLPTSLQTAEEMQLRAGLTAGQRVLVTGASGGVGSGNVQLAALRGALVTAVTSRAKGPAVLDLGAREVVGRDDLTGHLAERSGTYDVVLDVVGGHDLTALLAGLVRGGHFVTAGAISGAETAIDLRTVIYADLTITGQATARPETLPNLVRYARERRLSPRIAATYPLGDLGAAQAAFMEKQHVGKIVIDVDRAGAPAEE